MSRPTKHQTDPGSICVLRLSAIGDVCNAVAAVQAIQKKHPEAKITWVIGMAEYQLVKGLPGIEFIPYNKRGGKQAHEAFKAELNTRRFDILLLMQVALRANLLSRHINAKRRIGFDWHRSKELHSLFINERIAAQQHAHVLDGFFGFAEALGVKRDNDNRPEWNIPIEEDDAHFAQDQISDGVPTLIIVPSASKAERNWLPERYARLADVAVQEGYRVLLCGGPGEQEIALSQQVQELAELPLTNLTGKTSLKQLYALIARARMLLAPDTGPVHMAVSLNTPVIGLYGHSNPARTGPYLFQEWVVEVYHRHLTQQTGKSVEALPWGKRVKGNHVMADIETEEVIKRFKDLNKALNSQ